MAVLDNKNQLKFPARINIFNYGGNGLHGTFAGREPLYPVFHGYQAKLNVTISAHK